MQGGHRSLKVLQKSFHFHDLSSMKRDDKLTVAKNDTHSFVW